jgi:hypothetical protein
MTETKKYLGGCHCGKVRYEVTADLSKLYACNCSICSKKGFLLTFAGTDQLTLLSGEDVLTDYQFNKKNVHHLFCSVCGIQSFGRGKGPDGKEMVAVNARCLDGVDFAALPVESFDGKSL